MAVSPEERALVAQAIKRDREAFAKLWVLHRDSVRQRVLAIVKNSDVAEDITSEAFLRAWNAIDKFQPRDVTILAWLCRIAERIAFKQLKKQRPSVGLEDVWLEANPLESPEYIVERKAESADIMSALVTLPEAQRQVLSKRFLDDLSYDDVGQILGKSVGTVRVIQHRALKALKLVLVERRHGRTVAPTPARRPQ